MSHREKRDKRFSRGIGPRTAEQLENNLQALDVDMPAEVFTRLEELSWPAFGVPHEINRETLPRMLGGKSDLVDLPNWPVA